MQHGYDSPLDTMRVQPASDHAPGVVIVSITLCLLLALAVVWLVSAARLSAPGEGAQQSSAHLLSLTRYVNPFVGTTGDGNTFPGADVPFGMMQWSPDSSAGGLQKPGGYNYGDLIITGFSLTHLSGAGCVAYGNIPFMPTSRPITMAPAPNGSPYSDRFTHGQEQATPGYYGVRLASGIQVRLSVTPRTGFGTFTYPRKVPQTLLINAGGGAGASSNTGGADSASVRVIGRNTVTGSATAGHFCGLSNRYTIYFAAHFSRPFRRVGAWQDGALYRGKRAAVGPHSGAYVTFGGRGRMVAMKVGVSYVSVHNALLNLRAEDPGWSLETIRRQATARWNWMLNRIQVSAGARAERETFYTALYHALLQPSLFSDANGQYRGFDGRVHDTRGYEQYANFSGWDIYRSEMPLLAWLVPHRASDMVRSLLADAKQEGWLPKWPVANAYTGEMNGDSADPIIADAYAFGARGFDIREALRYMMKGASQPGMGPDGYQERFGLSDYLRLGYVPPEPGGWGSAATTLEYTLDDFSIAQLARVVGARADYRTYMRRSGGWRKLFNPATGFVEARLAGGSWPVPFNPTSMDGFVEGNAWQYAWMVPYDLRDLFHAMGGAGRAAARLDAFFHQLNAGPLSPHYWAGNEPGLEVPWEYDFAGRPWRTQAVVRRIETSLYTPTPAGLPGNDDLGTLSAWYVWAAIGLYPEIPGVPGLVLGSPLFPHITVYAGMCSLTIEAPAAAPRRPYIHALSLNSKSYGQPWLPLSAIGQRTVMSFVLASRPDRNWGAGPAERPPSFAP